MGSSSDATVTSIHSELTSSWINRGVPQQDANERNRSAYKILRTSPLAIFIALLFWGWLWGPLGMLLAVPIMMVIKSVCDHIEALQPIGHLLGEGK